MKLEATARLRAHTNLVLAAPVSPAERERFISELMKMDPAFRAGEYETSFGREDRTKIFIKGKANGLKAISALIANGWAKDGSWNNFNPALAPDFPVFSKNGEWPINVHINPLGVSFQAPTSDRVGEDNAFKLAMAKMAKAVMPGQASIDLKTGTAEWRKRGGHAGSKIISKVIQKAKAVGFKPASFFGNSHPAGNWVSSDETYLHPDGWILTFGSSYGQTKSDNSFWVRLSVDYKRGEDKEAMAKLPQPGTLVRFANGGYTSVGRVVKIQNTRLLVNTSSSQVWVDVDTLKPMPKEGDSVTYWSPTHKSEFDGKIDSLSYGYTIVKRPSGNTDYVHYQNLRTVNGAKWE